MVRPGSVVTILGPGGAGKTTTVDRGRAGGRGAVARWSVVRRPGAAHGGRGGADGPRPRCQRAIDAGQRCAGPTSWPISPIARCCWCSTTASISSNRSARLVARADGALPAPRRARHEPRPTRSDRRVGLPAQTRSAPATWIPTPCVCSSSAVASAATSIFSTSSTLCRAIDGLPLAIELAATRSHALTPAEMTERMRSAVAVVSTRDPTVPDRQRSLDRLLDWSLDLLTPGRAPGPDPARRDRGRVRRLARRSRRRRRDTARRPCAGTGLVAHRLVARRPRGGRRQLPLHVALDRSVLRVRGCRRRRTGGGTRPARRCADGQARPGRARCREGGSRNRHRSGERPGSGGPIPRSPTSVARSLAWSIGQYHDVIGFVSFGNRRGRAMRRAATRAPGPISSRCSRSRPTSISASARWLTRERSPIARGVGRAGRGTGVGRHVRRAHAR